MSFTSLQTWELSSQGPPYNTGTAGQGPERGASTTELGKALDLRFAWCELCLAGEHTEPPESGTHREPGRRGTGLCAWDPSGMCAPSSGQQVRAEAGLCRAGIIPDHHVGDAKVRQGLPGLDETQLGLDQRELGHILVSFQDPGGELWFHMGKGLLGPPLI